MKLHYSPASPYARKVRIVAIEAGVDDRIELILTLPREAGAAFHAVNPLARVPALEIDEGEALFDSPVICEYLDCEFGGGKLHPETGPARWQALRQQALADGIMDAAVPLRHETMRPEDQQNHDDMIRWREMIARAVDTFAEELDEMGGFTIGTLAAACALGYLDLRFPDIAWRDGRDGLAAWYAEISQRPSIQATESEG